MTQSRPPQLSAAKSASPTSGKDLLDVILGAGIEDFVWVPCSVTAGLEGMASRDPRVRFVATNHEGNLPGVAAGIWFATGRPALVHMQNSGFCNAGDGFISFLSPEVYGISVVALVTWRGYGEEDDSEPHLAIGARTDVLTEALFGPDASRFGCRDGIDLIGAVASACEAALEGKIGVVRVSPRGFVDGAPPLLAPDLLFERHSEATAQAATSTWTAGRPTRDEALRLIVSRHPNAAILFGNGYTSRAAQAVVDRPGNFYNVGYMGGTLAIGWGLATRRPDLEVIVVDGDQNALMSTFKDALEAERPANLSWYVLDNGIGASVGTSESIPLGTRYDDLAIVIRTLPDEPGSFRHPRVGTQDGSPLNTLARRFRGWIADRTEGHDR